MKMYFLKGDEEYCYPLQYWKKYLSDNELNKIELFEAKRETGTGYFFCKEHGEVGEVGECGRFCNEYKPNNGKNGRCKHYRYVYECADKIKVITQ